MGAKFAKGDRVRCVAAAAELVAGGEYVIDAVFSDNLVSVVGHWLGYYESRFELIDGDKASKRAEAPWLSPEDLVELARIAEEYHGGNYRRAVLHRALDALRSATEAGAIGDGWYRDSVGGWRRRP